MGRWANENKWDHLVTAAAERHGIPAWVIKATIAQESGFNPKAYRAEPAIGDASRGLMQVLYRTARAVGYDGPAGNDATKLGGLFAPVTSINIGTAVLADAVRRFGNEPWPAIYAAYNSGAVRRNDAGQFINSKGSTNVDHHVQLWTQKANYFRGVAGLPPLVWPPAPGSPGPGAPEAPVPAS